ncbi:MAG: peptidoglycan DD-metalloendopeptidase family protein [Leptospiraceae bacterium]|nr:peptidoglycan DD-metalloendopeptidase family protein [Leptospiraceae bacterium]
MSRLHNTTFVILLSLLISGMLGAEAVWLKRSAVAAPGSTQASLQQHDEGDEIDSEINNYFQGIDQKTSDLDKEKLARLFGDDDELIAKDVEVVSLANRGNLDYMTSYRVRPGDSIWSISTRMKLKPENIVKHNPELKKRPLYIGEEIIIVKQEQALPASATRSSAWRYHTVKKGEYLGRIARTYKVSLSQLRSWNGLKKGSVIQIGQKLKIQTRQQRIPAGYKYAAVFDWPVRGVITSGYGHRSNPFTRTSQYHKGIDIGVSIGTPFQAARDGVVILSRRMGGYGNCIFVRHTNGYVSVYAHNKINMVKVGDVVRRGQVIGQVGRTGSATGPHLHFEVRKWKRPMNPFTALSRKELVLDKVANR